jgi:hypothetical protein
MFHAIRRLLSRKLMRMRVSLFGNNHSMALNLRYRSYLAVAQNRYKPTVPPCAVTIELAEKFRRDGYVVIPSPLSDSEATALKEKVDMFFTEPADVLQVTSGLYRLIDGAERISEVTRVIAARVAQVVEHYYGSHFKLYNMSFYRTVPDRSTPVTSFLWHFDNSPDEEIKLMIYLDDVTEETGAFRFKNLSVSEQVRALGFCHRDDYDKASHIFDDPASTVTAIGGPGTAILFRQGRVVHKATAPKHSHRDVVTMVIIPSLITWREHYARNRHLLSTNAGLCKNPWTDEPENIGYRY